MLMVAQVSSMETSLSGSKAGRRERQASRASATFGRSCSAAWGDFFLNVSLHAFKNRSTDERPT
jgi:hypothetical protein